MSYNYRSDAATQVNKKKNDYKPLIWECNILLKSIAILWKEQVHQQISTNPHRLARILAHPWTFDQHCLAHISFQGSENWKIYIWINWNSHSVNFLLLAFKSYFKLYLQSTLLISILILDNNRHRNTVIIKQILTVIIIQSIMRNGVMIW